MSDSTNSIKEFAVFVGNKLQGIIEPWDFANVMKVLVENSDTVDYSDMRIGVRFTNSDKPVFYSFEQMCYECSLAFN